MARSIEGITLPSEIETLLTARDALSVDLLTQLSAALMPKLNEAKTARKSSGIEETWQLCDEAYDGIDDLNRGEYLSNRWVRPTTMNTAVTTAGSPKGQADKRSTAFVRLTSRYVDAGTAKVCEILLPPDDKAFSFEPTPVPQVVAHLTTRGMAVPYGMPNLPTPLPQATPTQPGQPATSPMTPPPSTPQDLAIAELERARLSAKRAETRIYDWMVECQHNREMRKVIFDAARLGVGVLKGPFPDTRRSMSMSKDHSGKLVLAIANEIVPADKWVDPWNIFPDPACGENLADGSYIFERDFISEKQLEDLRDLPGYLSTQIDKVIAMGPNGSMAEKRDQETGPQKDRKSQYEIWYFHGMIKREEFTALNPTRSADLPKGQQTVYAIVTMINEIPIRGALNPLDSGELPYHSVPWQRRSGFWAGVGVSEQIQVPQKIVNAGTRALLNNAGISAGPQIIVNQDGVTPANGEWVITPNKIWYASSDGVIDDVRKTFFAFDITNVGRQLMDVINYAMRLAEESTSIPLITQGQSGDTTPETLGATQLQNNNANQLLRSIGYSFDDFITVRLVKMYHEYLLLDPMIPIEEKGDFKIHAHGSVAMVERAIQEQTIAQMNPLSLNPAYGVDPKKWFAVLAKSKHLDPTMFQYTPEEQAKIDARPQPPAPQVQVAQIRAQVEQAKMAADEKRAQAEDALDRELAQLEAETSTVVAQMQNATAQLRVRMDTDRDTAFVQAETARAQADYLHNMKTLELKKELAIMDYAAKQQMSLEQVKSKLADTAMKLRVQKELAAAEHHLALTTHSTPSADNLMKPPTQTPGKAGNGNAFTQLP